MAFKHISEIAEEAQIYIDKRRKGEITSCRTGYTKLDEAMLDGIEYGSVISIGGRPSSGKTSYSSCIIRGILRSNPIEDMQIIDFAWEMSAKSLLLRDLSADSGDSYKDIISAGKEKVSDERMDQYQQHLDRYKTLPWFFEENPKTAKAFGKAVREIVEEDPYKKRVVRIDHSILALQSAEEGSETIMLQNLLKECIKIKKESDIIFIILTQLLRDLEKRQVDGSDDAFPKQSDVFGGDAVAQASETVILLNRPAMYNVPFYGRRPGGVTVGSNDIFGHIVKARNAAPNLILRYEAQFEKMKMREI